MALYKEIEQDDGVMTTYHRIRSMSFVINDTISITIVSYINNRSRVNVSVGDFAPYIRGMTYMLPYDETMTITKAYEYLKTLPEFEGAEDI
jgi:hypothetical protein